MPSDPASNRAWTRIDLPRPRAFPRPIATAASCGVRLCDHPEARRSLYKSSGRPTARRAAPRASRTRSPSPRPNHASPPQGPPPRTAPISRKSRPRRRSAGGRPRPSLVPPRRSGRRQTRRSRRRNRARARPRPRAQVHGGLRPARKSATSTTTRWMRTRSTWT